VPSIKVTDASGKPIRDLLITAEVEYQSGSITVIDPVTDGAGVATVGAWTLGTRKGAQTLTLKAPGLPAVTFTVTVKGFDVTIRYVGTPAPSAAVQAAVDAAKVRLEQVVVSEISDQPLVNVNANSCSAGAGTLNETVDDLLIFVSVVPIDGAAGANAQSGPCGLRLAAPYFTYLGQLQIDDADATRLLSDGSLTAVVLHEMLHAVGFGAGWSVNALVQGAGGANPIFNGAAARTEYVKAGGTSAAGVPVANVGPVGTRDVHWREGVFVTELMSSSYQAGVLNPLSAITIASLADLGYLVSYTTADAFTVQPPGQIVAPVRAQNVRASTHPMDVVITPMIFIDRQGRQIKQ
jgi:hypothetical protein